MGVVPAAIMKPSLIILALASNLSLGIRIWHRKYVQSVGLVPRLNVVGVPSEARLLYVVDNDLSEEGTRDGSHVRRRRGLLDYFRTRPVYQPGTSSISNGPMGFHGYTNRPGTFTRPDSARLPSHIYSSKSSSGSR